MAAQPASSPPTTVMYLRLWVTEESGSSKRLPSWDDGTPLVRLLQEILCFHGAVPNPVADAGGLLLADCADQFQAVRSARQMQALVTGFSGAAESRTVAASIAIVPPSRMGNTDVTAEIRTYLQQRAQPAQILFAFLAGDTPLPATAFKTEALSSSEPRLQLTELLWRHKDRAAAAAVQAHARAVKQRERVTAALALPPTPKVAQPSLAERSRDLREDTATALGTVQTKLHRWLSRTLLAASALSNKSVLRSRHRWTGLAAAFALLCGVFFLVHRPSPKPAALVPPAEATPAATIAQKPIAAVAGKPSMTPLTAAPELPAKTAPPSEKRGGARVEPMKKTKADEEPERVARDRGGLSSEQTRQVLSRGQTQLDRGCYALAIGYFRRVLEDDPRNGSASSGIEKARKRLQLDAAPKAACQ